MSYYIYYSFDSSLYLSRSTRFKRSKRESRIIDNNEGIFKGNKLRYRLRKTFEAKK